MKKTTRLISGIIVIVAVIIATGLVFGNSELLQGKINKFTPKDINVKSLMVKPLMLVLFSEDIGYPIQIFGGNEVGIEAAIRLNSCGTAGTGDKWCYFGYSDEKNNDQEIKLVENEGTLIMHGRSGYNYVVKVVDVTDFPSDSTQSEKAIIELDKVQSDS